MGFEPPSWGALAAGARPEPQELDDFEPGVSRQGWQHPEKGTSGTESSSNVWCLATELWCGHKLVQEQVLLCQSLQLPFSRGFRSHLFRVVLLRRLRGSAWAQEIRFGECSWSHLWRGRGACHSQRADSRSGSASARRHRRSQVRGGRGRPSIVWWMPVGSGHHARVRVTLRWVS